MLIYKPWMPNIPNRTPRTNCDQLTVGNLNISFHRTLRLPEDGKTHGLPPSLGRFPVRLVEDYKDKVPAKWLEHGGVFLPLYQREALWMSFSVVPQADVGACAVKVATGKVNAISGKPWSDKLEKAEDAVLGGKDPVQDYMVCPKQPWLDGFNTGDGSIRQFVAMPLGMGYTVEKQVTGKEDTGGIQIAVFPAKPGVIPPPARVLLGGGVYNLMDSSYSYESASQIDGAASMGMDEDHFIPVGATKSYSSNVLRSASATRSAAPARLAAKGAEMGLAAGGKMNQKIYADEHGIDTWDVDNGQRLFVHFVNSQMWTELTGEAAPPSPVDVHTYTRHGYPWFSIYDEGVAAVQGSGTLANVKPVSEMDKEKGFEGQQDDSALDESANTIKLGKPAKKPVMLGNKPVVDGKW